MQTTVSWSTSRVQVLSATIITTGSFTTYLLSRLGQMKNFVTSPKYLQAHHAGESGTSYSIRTIHAGVNSYLRAITMLPNHVLISIIVLCAEINSCKNNQQVMYPLCNFWKESRLWWAKTVWCHWWDWIASCVFSVVKSLHACKAANCKNLGQVNVNTSADKVLEQRTRIKTDVVCHHTTITETPADRHVLHSY